jgi:heme/copper-type cytochrome/quinol oxidase subunit 2
LTASGNRQNTIIAVLVIVAIVLSGLFGYYISTVAKPAPAQTSTQTQTTTVNLDVVPDYGGATYDAFVLAATMQSGFVPTPATNTTGPGPNNNNITVTAGTPVKFVVTSLDNAINQNFSAQVTIPFTVYNDTASGQVLQTYSAGQSISNMSIGHTFTIAQMNLNIPIPPTTVVTFTMTFSKPGLYLYACLSPCGPGMGLMGYMEGYVIVNSA